MFSWNTTYASNFSLKKVKHLLLKVFSSFPLVLPFGSKVTLKSDSFLSLTWINGSRVDWRLDGWGLPQALIQKIILYRNLSGSIKLHNLIH